LLTSWKKLQAGRKSKLNKACDLRKMLQGLMETGKHSDVQNAFEGCIALCDEIRCMHESIDG